MLNNLLRKIYTFKITSFFLKTFWKPWKGKGAILVYHRVLPDDKIEEDLNLGLAVSCSQFEKQIKLLKENYSLVSINDFVKNIINGDDKFLVSITFDDGYKDNLKYALPILEKYKIPATIYISTRFLETQVEMWWYELKDLIEKNITLQFIYNKKNFNFDLKNKKQKEKTFKEIRKLMMTMSSQQQLNFLEAISKNKNRKDYSQNCINKDELKILDKNSLITIGSHSHNHLNLKILNDEELVYEVKKSVDILEKLLSHKIEHFAYPYGGADEASEREYNLIKNFNFLSAVTSKAYVIKKPNLFALPRIYVGPNTCEKTMSNHLTGFYNFIHKIF